jgi:Zn-dependent M28 family amino/carboxypeptidase
VTAIASTPHNIDHPEALEAAARYIENDLRTAGYEVETQPYQAAGQTVRNIHVTLGQAGAGLPSFVVGAHYDSAGIAPGANDNGSGVAMVLELARQLRTYQPKRHILRLVLFVNEERPFSKTEAMGSVQYANMLAAREKVAGMISLETLGAYYDKPGTQELPFPLGLVLRRDIADFVTFVGPLSARDLVNKVAGSFRSHTQFPSVAGVTHPFVRGTDWSDHWSFNRRGIPAIMITDTAFFRYPHYHKASDTPDKLDYDRLARVTMGIGRMLRQVVD